jgi:hypothetical protein
MTENLAHVSGRPCSPPERSVKRNTVTIRTIPMLFDI